MQAQLGIFIRVSPKVKRELRALADKKGLSLSAYIRTLIMEKLEETKKEVK